MHEYYSKLEIILADESRKDQHDLVLIMMCILDELDINVEESENLHKRQEFLANVLAGLIENKKGF